MSTAEAEKLREAQLHRVEQAERISCERPPVRGTAIEAGIDPMPTLRDPASSIRACLARAMPLRTKVLQCDDADRCTPRAITQRLDPHPDVLAACKPLLAAIGRAAVAPEGCSPYRGTLETADPGIDALRAMTQLVLLANEEALALDDADIARAARGLIDAIRFAHDAGRHGVLAANVTSAAIVEELAEALRLVLEDPRISMTDARTLATEIDVIIGSAPTFADSVRQELADAGRRAERASESITGDVAQDRLLRQLAIGRVAERLASACSGGLRRCVETYRHPAPPDAAVQTDYLGAPKDAKLRERVVRVYESSLPSYGELARQIARGHYALSLARLQAELSTMTTPECRDAVDRNARLDVAVQEELRPSGIDQPELQLTRPSWLGAAPATKLRCAL